MTEELIINHGEALQYAHMHAHDSNLARCYLELTAIRIQPVPLPTGYTDINDYIAEQEKDPVRKAALDEARVRLREELARGPVPVNAKELWEECADMEAYGEAAMSYDGFKFAVSGLTPAADQVNTDTVSVPRQIAERAALLLLIGATHGIQSHLENGELTPNAKICAETSDALLRAAQEGKK
jgi:hypothetical protein